MKASAAPTATAVLLIGIYGKVKKIYSVQRLYQYDEDDFLVQVLIVKKPFSNYKFTSKQNEAVIW